MAHNARSTTAVVNTSRAILKEEGEVIAASLTLPNPPWARMAGESNRAFYAFGIYRDCSALHRTLRMVQDIVYPHSYWAGRTISRWHRTFLWEQRVQLWEDEKDRQRLLTEAETIRSVVAQQTSASVVSQSRNTGETR